MRDEFGEIDPDEIDIIEADPGAFGPAPRADGAGEGDGTNGAGPTTSPRRSRRTLVIAIGAALLVAAAATVIVWRPWSSDDHHLSLPSHTVAAATLTERLVLDRPPVDPTSSAIGAPGGGETTFGDQFADAEGYFFVGPNAKMTFDGSSEGQWAAFYAVPKDSDNAPSITVEDGKEGGTVQGAPATIDQQGPGQLVEVEFGPVDGYLISVASSGLSKQQALALAEVVGVENGIPVVRDSTALLDLQPLGSMAAYAATYELLLSAQSGGAFPTERTVSVQYGTDENAVSVTSREVSDKEWLKMAEFVLGGAADHTVHGHPAIAVETTGRGFGADATIVCWEEGGRMIMVTGHDDVDATLLLAESVRPATDEEWDAVVAVQGQGQFDSFGFES